MLTAAASEWPEILSVDRSQIVVLNVVFSLGNALHLELHTVRESNAAARRLYPPQEVAIILRSPRYSWRLAPTHVATVLGDSSSADQFFADRTEVGSGPFVVEVEILDGRETVVSSPLELVDLDDRKLEPAHALTPQDDGVLRVADKGEFHPAAAGVPELVYRDAANVVVRAPILALGPELHAWYLLGTDSGSARMHEAALPPPPLACAALVAEDDNWVTRFGTGTGSGDGTQESHAWKARRDELGCGAFRISSTLERWGAAHSSRATHLEPLPLATPG